eukprot:TRINITY_DN2174_c0_g2_i1.p1 TRINITY_DN2174_c0_g2~~TRINITY_DN2174_c0_g2_i1.p1  ORF type:complete len:833 (+),score=232.95 TRINITY_DN2174_c0_g2_i1:2-2500(+)
MCVRYTRWYLLCLCTCLRVCVCLSILLLALVRPVPARVTVVASGAADVTITLDADISTFDEAGFVAGLASLLGEPASRFQVRSVVRGSTIVTFGILPTATGAAPQSVADRLVAKVESDPSAVTAALGSRATGIRVNNPPPNNDSSSSGSGLSGGIIAAIVVPIVVVIIVLIVVVVLVVRSRRQKKQSDSDAPDDRIELDTLRVDVSGSSSGRKQVTPTSSKASDAAAAPLITPDAKGSESAGQLPGGSRGSLPHSKSDSKTVDSPIYNPSLSGSESDKEKPLPGRTTDTPAVVYSPGGTWVSNSGASVDNAGSSRVTSRTGSASTPAADLHSGWEIDYNELKLGTEIGRGAVGVVYKARWRGTLCVVKQMLGSGGEKDFLREARNMQNLRNHPNCVLMLGVCTAPDKPFCIVEEYIDGGSLERIIQDVHAPLGLLTCLQILRDVASGMQHLHKQHFLHCDLASRNILVSEKRKNRYLAKICDYGLSRRQLGDYYQATTDAKFPIRWSSPEVILFRKYSEASDVWSFAVVVYELLARRLPYAEMSNREVMEHVCDRQQRLPNPDRIEYPPELDNIVQRCFRRDPQARPGFDEIQDVLEGLLGSFRKSTTPRSSRRLSQASKSRQGMTTLDQPTTSTDTPRDSTSSGPTPPQAPGATYGLESPHAYGVESRGHPAAVFVQPPPIVSTSTGELHDAPTHPASASAAQDYGRHETELSRAPRLTTTLDFLDDSAPRPSSAVAASLHSEPPAVEQPAHSDDDTTESTPDSEHEYSFKGRPVTASASSPSVPSSKFGPASAFSATNSAPAAFGASLSQSSDVYLQSPTQLNESPKLPK